MPSRAAQPRTRRLAILAGVVALAATLAVALVALTGEDEPPAAGGGSGLRGQAETAELLAGIPQDGRFLGSPSAPVTLVEFADLQCPFCAQYARDAFPTIVREHVRTGKVRLEFRPLAFLGPDSITGAQLVAGAGRQDKLWNVLDLLFANQGAENSGWLDDALGQRVLRAAGIDPVAGRRAASSAATARELQEAQELATASGIDGTPAFLVGRRGAAFRPLQVPELTAESFTAALDAAAAGT